MSSSNPIDSTAERREFWTLHLERSHDLLAAMTRYPVEECGETFVAMPEAMAAAGVEVWFSTTRIAGRYDRIFHIRAGLIDDLIAIARAMNERGWIMRIEEGYRTREMQTALSRNPAVFDKIVAMCRWEIGGATPPWELVARRAGCLVANTPCTGTHTCGAAVDISVFRRDDGTEVWRGNPYLEMSECTPMATPFVGVEEQQHRAEITAIMEARGFLHYPGEFWHYNKGDALYHMMAGTGKPGQYGPVHWDPATNTVTRYDDYYAPLTPPDLLQENLRQALQRLDNATAGAAAAPESV